MEWAKSFTGWFSHIYMYMDAFTNILAKVDTGFKGLIKY